MKEKKYDCHTLHTTICQHCVRASVTVLFNTIALVQRCFYQKWKIFMAVHVDKFVKTIYHQENKFEVI